MYVNPNFPVYFPSPCLFPNYISSWTWRGVPLKTTSVFFSLSEHGPVGELCVCVCVQSRGGYMFGLVRLSVYVCVPPWGSVRQNASVTSFLGLPKKHR